MAYPIVKVLRRRMGMRMCFVFRSFPLTMVHPHAESVAEAAEAAGGRRKFWKMHDILFEKRQAFEIEDLAGYAGNRP